MTEMSERILLDESIELSFTYTIVLRLAASVCTVIETSI